VHDSRTVGGAHGMRQLFDQRRGLAGFRRSLGEPASQAASLDKFEREVGAALMLAHSMDLNDAGVLELRDQLGLSQEPGEVLRRGLLCFGDHLDRYNAAEFPVARLVNHTHAASAEHAFDLVSLDRPEPAQ
jgi:hypothetical protein